MKRRDDSVPRGASVDASTVSLQEILSLLHRGRRVIVISLLVVVACVAVYTVLTRPVYEATAQVLIESRGREGTPSFMEFLGTASTNRVTNELEILRSVPLAEKVSAALQRMEFVNGPSTSRIALLAIDAAAGEASASLPRLTENLLRCMDFTAVKESDIIRISARTNDPDEAALLANTYAEVYVDENLTASRSKSKALREFLDSQLQSKRAELDSIEATMGVYMRTSGMVSLDATEKKTIEQLAEIEATRDAIGVDIKGKSKTLAGYKGELALQEPNVAKAIGQSNDAYIRLLQEQLAKLEVQRDVLIAQNPAQQGKKIYSEKVAEIDGQINSLKRKLEERTQTFLRTLIPGEPSGSGREGSSGYLAGLRQKIVEQQIDVDGLTAKRDALNRILSNYEQRFAKIPEKSISLARLQRARLSTERLYLLVEEKYHEAGITEKSQFGYVNIVGRAVVPLRPVSPKVWLNLLLALFGGLFCGVGILMMRATLDVRVRTADDLRRHGFTPLSTIVKTRLNGETRTSTAGGTRDAAPENGFLLTRIDRLAPVAEAYRHLRTSILHAEADVTVNSILVTSALPREGKSTTAANLAIVFAEAEHKVLLVDADIRRPSLHVLFGVKREPGLTNLILGKSVLDDVVRRHVLEHLDIIPCGMEVPNPAGILGSRRIAKIMDQFTQLYDIVILDSPPLHAVTDAAMLAGKVSGCVIVASAGLTTIPALRQATGHLQDLGVRVFGVVLNNYDIRSALDEYQGNDSSGYYGGEYNAYHSTGPGSGAAKRNGGNFNRARIRVEELLGRRPR